MPTWNAIWCFVNKAQNWSRSFIHINHFTTAVGQGWGPVLMSKKLPPLQTEYLFTLLQRVAETYPICDDPLSGSAPHRNIKSRYVKRSPIQYGFMSAQELHVLRYIVNIAFYCLLLGKASQNYCHLEVNAAQNKLKCSKWDTWKWTKVVSPVGLLYLPIN